MSKAAKPDGYLGLAIRSRVGGMLRTQYWLWPLMAAAVLSFVGLWVRAKMENAVRAQIAGNMETIRDANAEALLSWAAAMKSQAEVIAANPDIVALLDRYIARATANRGRPEALATSPEFAKLRAQLKPLEEGRGFDGFSVLDTNLVLVAAAREEYIGLECPPACREQMQVCLEGKAVVTAPFLVSNPIAGNSGPAPSKSPLMFAAAPVRAADGSVIAIIALRILPERDFTRILSTARAGATGETYTFNREGVMLSGSRFDPELKKLGLLPDAAQSLLTLDLRDPLVNLHKGRRPPKHRADLPFTRAVTEALAKRNASDTHGYRGYHGVAVVGAWKWLPEFDMGIVTEMEPAEALAPLRIARAAFWFLFALLVACSLLVFVLTRLAGGLHQAARDAAARAQQLGQYTLGEEIGSGGFGVVYRGYHALMRRPVAVKILNPLAGPTAVARFEREVQMTCRLSHPNTIVLYDYGRNDAGCFYYAMEYLDGIPLDRLIEKHGPQPEGRVIHVLRQVCGSLAEAHSLGLVHRDIKPQNIFLTSRGGIPDFVKVLDFGLVKARDTKAEIELTGAQATLGTPSYMSPEAVKNPAGVGPASDLYSLGCVGYALLTGGPVFNGLSITDILLQQLRMPPELPSERLGRPVSPDLEMLLMTCLSKDPSQRPASAATLKTALAQCDSGRSWTTQDAREWWNREFPPASDAAHKTGL